MIERYTPFLKDGELLTTKNKPQWMLLIAAVLTLVAIIWTIIIATPEPLYFVPSIIILFGMSIGDYESFHLFRKKRADVRVYPVTRMGDRWYIEEEFERHPAYKTAVLEYLDFLRDGGDRNEHVEEALRKYIVQLRKEKIENDERNKKELAQMFFVTQEVKQYELLEEWNKKNDNQRTPN